MLQRGVTSVNDGREKRKEELLSTLADKRRKINPIRCHEIEEKIIIGQRSGGIFFFLQRHHQVYKWLSTLPSSDQGVQHKTKPKIGHSPTFGMWKMFSASFLFPFQGCCCCVFPLTSKSGHLYPDMILNTSFTFPSHSAYHAFRTFPCGSTACLSNWHFSFF